MNERENVITLNCNFSDVRPIMMALPYPELQVREKNLSYANILSADYCGGVSELTAITQYINNENRLSCEHCKTAKIFLGIAMAEMMHLQKLGELIVLLGGNVDFSAMQSNGRRRMWTPEYLTIPENMQQMIAADIESEKAAINPYRMHIKMIKDPYIDAVLERIIKDEEYHIMILRNL